MTWYAFGAGIHAEPRGSIDATWRSSKSPSSYYVYTISVSGVVRYIGKGKGLRLYSHMREVRSRLRRDFRINNIGSRLQRNLTEAVLSGAKVAETILVDNLTEPALTSWNTINCVNMSSPAGANSSGT